MIRLRELSGTDVTMVNRWRADRQIADLLVGTFRHVNYETDAAWFDSYMQDRDHSVRLGIVLDATDELIGVCYILSIDWISRSAEFGIFIGDSAQWGKGYGTAAARLCLEHAFMDLNLHRLSLGALSGNGRAIHTYEKCGFAHEGMMPGATYKNGEYRDVVLMGLVREDFIVLREGWKS